jgi:mannose-1-phosphate guanylyltransferase/mannose-6-phosphate isomerase
MPGSCGFSDIVILAGGIGERLWPLSTREHPKQFIKTGDGISFLQMSLIRALALRPVSSILVVTRQEFVPLAVDQCRELICSLPVEERAFLEEKIVVLPEPEAKHTTAAIYFACHFIATEEPGSRHTILVLTSDHIIKPQNLFLDACKSAADAANENYFVCFGIKPAAPSSEFGYIQTGAHTLHDSAVYDITAFHEKPDAETAHAYLTAGNYCWNSGMFAFTSSFFFGEIGKYAPEFTRAFSAVSSKPQISAVCNNIRVLQKWEGLDAVYRAIPAIAIDRSLAEKTKRARCVITRFDWSDVGNWDAFAEYAPVPQANRALVKSDDCYVHSDIPVALCGVSGLIVVIKDGKALIVKKGESALVHEAVARFPVPV